MNNVIENAVKISLKKHNENFQCWGCIYQANRIPGLPCAVNPSLENEENCEEKRNASTLQLGQKLYTH